MTLWLFLASIAVLAFAAHRTRSQWHRSLDLLGTWHLESSADSISRSLTLSGKPASGSYVAKDGNAVERGRWWLRGRTLRLLPVEGGAGGADAGAGVDAADVQGTEKSYELRLFEPGRIGLDGPDRVREIYIKRESNVIPLRKRS